MAKQAEEQPLAGAASPRLAWTLVPTALLRHTGFSFDLVKQLSSMDLSRRTADLLAALAAADALAAEIDDLGAHIRDRGAGPALRSIRRRHRVDAQALDLLSAGSTSHLIPRVIEWNNVHQDLDCSCQSFEVIHREALEQSTIAVMETFRADEWLRDVLLLSNDSAYPVLAHRLRTARDLNRDTRRLVDTLVLYQQRVAVKNETHSHFGPFAPIVFDSRLRGVSYSVSERRRSARLTHWAGQALVDAWAGETTVTHLRPRQQPLMQLRGSRLQLWKFDDGYQQGSGCGYHVATTGDLTPLEQTVLAAVDGASDQEQIVLTALGASSWHAAPDASVRDALRRLIDIGAVIHRLEIPVGTADVLSWLRRVPRLGGVELAVEFSTALDRLARLLGEMETAGHERRVTIVQSVKAEFSRLTGRDPNRGRGAVYADRSVFYEECRSEVTDVKVGADVAACIEGDLGVFYDLFLAAPRLRFSEEQRILHRWTDRFFGAGSTTPYLDFLAGWSNWRDQIRDECRAIDERIAELTRDFEQLIQGRGSMADAAIELDRTELETLLDRYPRQIPALCNPDVMIAASPESLGQGDFKLVVGDCHAWFELLTRSSVAPLWQSEDPGFVQKVWSAFQTILEPEESLVELATLVDLEHSNKTRAQASLLCPVQEFQETANSEVQNVVAVRDLVVRSDRDGLRLLDRTGRRLRLLGSPARYPTIAVDPLAAFGFPRHFDAAMLPLSNALSPHVPRLSCGRIVLHREGWSIPAEAFRCCVPADLPLSEEAGFFAMANRLRRGLRIPDRCFVKVAEEPKPVYVDWNSPLLVRQLRRFVKVSTGPVRISEMFPDSGDLWLTTGRGSHTAEIRCALFAARVGSYDGHVPIARTEAQH